MSFIYIEIASYHLTHSWNKLHVLMHNIVLYIFRYVFPWLHVLCDLRLINNDRKHVVSAIFTSVFFGGH